MEIVEKVVNFTLEFRPKEDKSIYFKTEFDYRRGRCDILTLTYEDRSRWWTLADKYPQYKHQIQGLIDEEYEDLFGSERLSGKPNFSIETCNKVDCKEDKSYKEDSKSIVKTNLNNSLSTNKSIKYIDKSNMLSTQKRSFSTEREGRKKGGYTR